MRIMLTGPVCSGKSTLGRKLAARYGLPYFSIDEIRKEVHAEKKSLTDGRSFLDDKHHDNYLEKIAINRFHKEIYENSEGVFETSGYGKTFRALDESWVLPLIHFHLKCSATGLHKRLSERLKKGYEWGPVPRHWTRPPGAKQSVTIKNLIQWMIGQPEPHFHPAGEDLHRYVRHTINTSRMNEKKVLEFCREKVEDFATKNSNELFQDDVNLAPDDPYEYGDPLFDEDFW